MARIIILLAKAAFLSVASLKEAFLIIATLMNNWKYSGAAEPEMLIYLEKCDRQHEHFAGKSGVIDHGMFASLNTYNAIAINKSEMTI